MKKTERVALTSAGLAAGVWIGRNLTRWLDRFGDWTSDMDREQAGRICDEMASRGWANYEHLASRDRKEDVTSE